MKGKKPRPKISHERVLDVALELIDHAGIEGLSMRKLGAELKIEAMTLYYYFPNKDAILDGLVERVTLSSLKQPIDEQAAWTEWIKTLAVSFHRELLRHPRLVPLIATRPVMTPEALGAVERIAAALCTAGFSPPHAFQIINIVTTFVIGHTLAEVGETPGDDVSNPDTAGLALLDPEKFPCFTQAIASGLGQPDDHQARFELALNAFSIGLSVLFSKEQTS